MTVKTDKTSTRRKPRSITATDSEWHRITARANQSGMSIGRYLVERALASEQVDDTAVARAEAAFPNDLQWELAERLLVTAAVVEARLAGTPWESEITSIKAQVRQRMQMARLLR